ncbi:hypothetical protein [Pseudoduganella buxea]|nr:hypothetical protein [Pseudoduganella buxea]
MLYIGLAIIVAGISAALSPLVWEWYVARRRREHGQEHREDD